MTKQEYQARWATIDKQFPTQGPERRNALLALNADFDAQAATVAKSATVAPKTGIAGAKLANDSRLKATFQAQKSQDDLEKATLSKPEYYAKKVADAVDAVAVPMSIAGAGALAGPIIRGGISALANGGVRALAKAAATQIPRGAARVAATVGAAKVGNEAGKAAVKAAGGGENLQRVGGMAGGALGGFTSNAAVNKVLPQKVPVSFKKGTKRTGPQWAQKATDAIERAVTPGGAMAYDYPKVAASRRQSQIWAKNRAEDGKRVIDDAETEFNKVFRKVIGREGKNQDEYKTWQRSVQRYIEDPGKNKENIPSPLMNSPTFMKSVDRARKILHAQSTDEIDYTTVASQALKTFRPYAGKDVKDDAILAQVRGWINNPRSIPDEEMLIQMQPFLNAANRSGRARNLLMKAIDTPKEAQRGSIGWQSAMEDYIPREYDYRINHATFGKGDLTKRKAAIEERMANVRADSIAEARSKVNAINMDKVSPAKARAMIDKIAKEQVKKASKADMNAAAQWVDDIVAGRVSQNRTVQVPGTKVQGVQRRKIDRTRDAALMDYLGEVEDPYYLMRRAFDTLGNKSGARKFIQGLVDSGAISKTPRAGWKDLEISAFNDAGDFNEAIAKIIGASPNDLPTGQVIGNSRWYAPADLRDMLVPKETTSAGRAWKNVTDIGREAKVTQNLPGQIRNAVGDLNQMVLAGASPLRLPSNLKWAYGQVTGYDKTGKMDDLAKVFRELGVTSGGFTRNLARPRGRTTYSTIKGRGGGGFEAATKQAGDLLRRAPGAKLSATVADVGERTRRLALARDRFMAMGGKLDFDFDATTVSGKKNLNIAKRAAEEVGNALFNYDNPSGITSAINEVAPVSSWVVNSYLNTPAMALNNPGRAAGMYQVYNNLSEILDSAGIDANITKNMPMGELLNAVTEMQDGTPALEALYNAGVQEITPGMNPVGRVWEALLGTNYAGFPVIDKKQSKTQQNIDRALYLGSYALPQNIQQFLPYANPRNDISNPTTTMQGGPVWNVLTGQHDKKTGEPKTTVPQAIAQMLGARVTRTNYNYWKKQFDWEKRKLGEMLTLVKNTGGRQSPHLVRWEQQKQKLERVRQKALEARAKEAKGNGN